MSLGVLRHGKDISLLAAMAACLAIGIFYYTPDDTPPLPIEETSLAIDPGAKPHLGPKKIAGAAMAMQQKDLLNPFTMEHEARQSAILPQQAEAASADSATAQMPSAQKEIPTLSAAGNQQAAAMRLKGIASSSQGALALIDYGGQTVLLQLGDHIAGNELSYIGPDYVTFERPDGKEILRLPQAMGGES